MLWLHNENINTFQGCASRHGNHDVIQKFANNRIWENMHVGKTHKFLSTHVRGEGYRKPSKLLEQPQGMPRKHSLIPIMNTSSCHQPKCPLKPVTLRDQRCWAWANDLPSRVPVQHPWPQSPLPGQPLLAHDSWRHRKLNLRGGSGRFNPHSFHWKGMAINPMAFGWINLRT